MKFVFNVQDAKSDSMRRFSEVSDIVSGFIQIEQIDNQNKPVYYGVITLYTNFLNEIYNEYKLYLNGHDEALTEIFNIQFKDIIQESILYKDSINFETFEKQIAEYITFFEKETELQEVIEIFKKKYNFGQLVCILRLFEGNYINQTLRDLRVHINEIMSHKNKGNTFNAPNFIDICIKQYCPSLDGCSMIKNEKSVVSTIFKTIMDELKYESNSDFYDNIVLCVFGVFNIARSTNNPPKVPYIDVNSIKILINMIDETDIDDYRTMKKKINNTSIEINVQNENSPIKPPLLYILMNYELEFLINKIKVLRTSSNIKDIEVLLQSIEILKNNFETIVNSSKPSLNVLQSIQTQFNSIITTLDEMNSVSAVGTLEYIDSLAKMSLTSTICSYTGHDSSIVPMLSGDFSSYMAKYSIKPLPYK
jgi:hypothetical protein